MSLSPLPVVEKTFTFPEIILEVLKGKKIARKLWLEQQNSYGLLVESELKLFINNELRVWSINDGDLEGTDWVVLP